MFYIQAATRKIDREKLFKSIWNAIKYFLKLFLKRLLHGLKNIIG